MSYYTLEPDGPHAQRPLASETMNPVMDSKFFEPLAILDAGIIDPELSGHRVLCVGFSTGAVDEFFQIENGEDDKWTLVSVDGTTPEDPTRGAAWAEPFEGSFHGLATLTGTQLVETTNAHPSATQPLIIRTGEPKWVQNADYAPSGENWRFLAQFECYYMHGTVYVYYDPATRRAHHFKQFS